MKRWPVMALILAVVVSAAQAGDTRFILYNLPRNTGMALPDDGPAFLKALAAKYGLTAPGLKEEGYGIQTGMPESFRNSIHGFCAKVRNFRLGGYVEVYLYASPPQQAAGKEFCAFALEYRRLTWLWALVKAGKKCDDAQFDDNARRLVLRFAAKIGNYNHKGYVAEGEVNSALDLFIAELKTRGVERMTAEEPVIAFETAVEKMEVKAGMLWGNDSGADLAKRALALLPSSLGN